VRIISGATIGIAYRSELALLVGIGVGGEVEEIGANAAVVEQRVALPGAP